MKIVVVRDKITNKLYKFTLGNKGEIIIQDNRVYNLDDLVVSILNIDDVEELDNRYFVVMSGISNG